MYSEKKVFFFLIFEKLLKAKLLKGTLVTVPYSLYYLLVALTSKKRIIKEVSNNFRD